MTSHVGSEVEQDHTNADAYSEVVLKSSKETSVQPKPKTSHVGSEVDPGHTNANACSQGTPMSSKETQNPPKPHKPAPLMRTAGLFPFSNTEAMKEKVRRQKVKPAPYHVHQCYHKTGLFQYLARHPLFENLTLGVIVVNAFWISVDTDGNTAETLLTAKPYFVVADVMFFGYFSFELFVRFMAFRRKRLCCRDAWFVFDSTLVFLYAFDPFTLAIMAAAAGGSGLNLPTAVLRLFRLARLSRLVRMLRSLPQLMVMIKGMLSAAASVGYTLGLLLIITYVFAIALVNLRDSDSEIAVLYFSTVPEAMHNLIIFGTFLDSLSNFILLVKNESVPCFIFTWLYIALASLTVMNMLIGVLCEVISSVAQEEQESMVVEKVNDKFSAIVRELDTDNDGTLSWSEFEKIIDYPDAVAALDSVNVDPVGIVEMAEDFFWEDGAEVTVSFEEFMELVLDLRGGQPASVKDIMRLGKKFSQKFFSMNTKINRTDEKLDVIYAKLDEMWKL